MNSRKLIPRVVISKSRGTRYTTAVLAPKAQLRNLNTAFATPNRCEHRSTSEDCAGNGAAIRLSFEQRVAATGPSPGARKLQGFDRWAINSNHSFATWLDLT
jgi:hypothetical protein